MKNVTTHVLIVVGVILMVLLIIGIVLFATDAQGTRTFIFGGTAATQSSGAQPVSAQSQGATGAATSAETDTATPGGFELSNGQIEALVSLGIDPDAVPSSISAEQEACFIGELGEARVEEIKAGAVPSALEFMRAESCIE